MKLADRLKFTATGTSAATITVGAAVAGMRDLATAISDDAGLLNAIKVGDTGVSFTVSDSAGNWESGRYTITSTTRIDQTERTASSNHGQAVVFNGLLTVYNDPLSADFARMPCDSDVPFSQSVPLTQPGTAWMAAYTVTGPLTFTPAAKAVKGALAYLALTADGANAPNTSAFKETIGSAGYDNRAGIVNYMQFFYDGANYRYAVDQDAAATPVAAPDTTAPAMTGTMASSSISTTGFTLSWSAASDNIAVTGYELSTNGGSTYADVGNVTSKAVTGLTANTPYSCYLRAYDAAGNRATPLTLSVTTAATADATAPTMNGALATSSVSQTGFTITWAAASDDVGVTGYEVSTNGGSGYTSVGNVLTITETGMAVGTTYQLAVRAYDAAGNRATALTASVTTSAATSPGAPTIGTATAGDTTASFAFTAPASNGGATITGYTLTVYNASTNAVVNTFTGTTSPISATGLTDGTGYYGKVAATNSAGTGAQSAQSNTVTPAAAPTSYPRLTALSATTVESGTGPYVYTGQGGTLSTEKGGLTTLSAPANGECYLEFEILVPDAVAVGFRGQQTTSLYGSFLWGLYAYGNNGSGVSTNYMHISGTAITAYPPQAGDKLRAARTLVNGTMMHQIQLCRSGGAWTVIDSTAVSGSYNIQVWIDVICTNSASVRLLAQSGLS